MYKVELWLWVLRTATVTLCIIGRRSWDVNADVMAGFAGWLMSDGYGQYFDTAQYKYRKYGKRLRCLAHLIRKAKGLAERCNFEATASGENVLAAFALLIEGIYAVRDDPSLDLPKKFAAELAQLKILCEQHRDHQQLLLRPHDWNTDLC